jgi:hypothetical protein
MMQYSWSDGSFENVSAFSTVNDSPTLIGISGTASGDFATVTPTGTLSQTAFFHGPPTGVTDCPACSVDNVNPQGTTTVPGNPAQLLVIGDTTTTPTNCINTKIRILAYQIQDASGTDIKMNVPTKEQFSSKSANTCNTTITTSETCSDTPEGIIHDQLTVGCNSVGGSCGYTYKGQQWVWCPGGVSKVVWTVGDLIVHNNSISVNGVFTSLKGRIITP